MPAHWELYYHIVWATKGRQELITPLREGTIFNAIRQQAEEQGGDVLAIGGMPDHVHVVTTIPPSIAPAEFVRKLKGYSSRVANLDDGEQFEWQTGYGIFTVSKRNLKMAVEYVEKQKEHHARHTVIQPLEWTSDQDEGPGGPVWN